MFENLLSCKRIKIIDIVSKERQGVKTNDVPAKYPISEMLFLMTSVESASFVKRN